MISLEQKEQWLNLAMDQMVEARGVDSVLCRYDQKINEAEIKGDKVQILLMTGAKKAALEVRASLISQAYLNLRSYFDVVSSESL